MAKEKVFVFIEEGGAGRAILAKGSSKKAAEKNAHASISGKVRYVEAATKAFKSNGLWANYFLENDKSNVIKFEKKEALVKKLFPPNKSVGKKAKQKILPIRHVYDGPDGKVGISFNDRTMGWQAHCNPEGAGGREVMFPLTANSEGQAKRQAIAMLRDEATHNRVIVPRPSRKDALDAVRTLICYAGDNPKREGLLDTPDRVVRSYDEFFAGYHQSAWDVLKTSFSETGSYDEMVLLTDIEFDSHCEHHMVPFIGKAHIAYLPDKTVVGISKIARLVEVYASRLQIQEKMTTQIADNLNIVLQPRGVAVVVEAQHMCMTTRGVKKRTVKMVTSCMTGVFRDDAKIKSEFLSMIGNLRNGQG